MILREETYKEINQALNFLKFNPFFFADKFSKYSSIYPSSNENIRIVEQKLNIRDKTILTIAGSGDLIFDMFLQDAKKIYSFDINSLAKHYIELKRAALVTLDYHEFINFFFKQEYCKNTFSEKTYQKIREKLEINSKLFWDALFSKYKGYHIRNSKLFSSFEEPISFLKQSISYLQPKNYEILQEKLITENSFNQKHSFLNIPLSGIHHLDFEPLDIIYLSNVADYIEENYAKPYLLNYKKVIEQRLSPLLTDDGIIIVAYMFFANTINKKHIPIINHNKERKEVFTNNYEEWKIDNSQIGDATDDHVLVYKKH